MRVEGFDAIILACFDDTGLAEARRLSGVPTIGIGEAAFHVAMLLGAKFSVVTTLAISVPVIEENLRDYGLESACLKVRASEVEVLDLEIDGSSARDKISNEMACSLREEQPGALVLGCAGMACLLDTSDAADDALRVERCDRCHSKKKNKISRR